MTGGEFSGVDLDLLADYVGGALTGTPDETLVTALVTDDPAWRDAHDALSVGMAAVGDELGRLGAACEPMPADITARLDAALAGLPPLAAASTPVADDDTEATAGRPEVRPGARPHLVAVPGESGAGAGAAPGGRRRTLGRRTLRSWAAPISVAAGVLAIAGIGISDLLSGIPRNDSASSESAMAGEPAIPLTEDEPGAGDPAAATRPRRVLTSGKDYARADLATGVRLWLLPKPSNAEKLNRSGAAPTGDAVPPVLQRLKGSAALQSCLDAITAQHDTGAVDSVESVDFAHFEGVPAVLVTFFASDGLWTWVSGPDCGAPGAGTDTRYQVRVG